MGDILDISTDKGWLYLVALLDTYSRLIVGWVMSLHQDEALMETALRMALAQRHMPQAAHLIQHTDRGSRYTADDYVMLLKVHGIQVSMSDKGNPYDNAMMESFFSTLRAELTDLERLPTRTLPEPQCSSSLKCFTIVSGFIHRWATAVHWRLKPPIYPDRVSYPPSN